MQVTDHSVSCNGYTLKLHVNAFEFRTRVKARHYSKKLSAQGTYYGAEVARGIDWQWENQDGEKSVNVVVYVYTHRF